MSYKDDWRWRSQNEAEETIPPETNLLRFLLVLRINFQHLERRQWLTTSLTGPSRSKFLAVLQMTEANSFRDFPLVRRSLPIPRAFLISMYLEVTAVLHYNNHDGVIHACVLIACISSKYSKCISAIKRILSTTAMYSIYPRLLSCICVFLFTVMHVYNLAPCVWEWRRYTIHNILYQWSNIVWLNRVTSTGNKVCWQSFNFVFIDSVAVFSLSLYVLLHYRGERVSVPQWPRELYWRDQSAPRKVTRARLVKR